MTFEAFIIIATVIACLFIKRGPVGTRREQTHALIKQLQREAKLEMEKEAQKARFEQAIVQRKIL